MSKPKSKPAPRSEQLRFSGPELSELLDRVMADHGETAAITEVNRVRSGGVAGFFCKEEFEVVVDEAPATDAAILDGETPDDAPAPDAVEEAGAVPDRLALRDVDLDLEPDGEIFAGPMPPGTGRRSDPARERFQTLLERRLDARSTTERELTTRRLGGRARLGPDRDGHHPATTPAVDITTGPVPPASARPDARRAGTSLVGPDRTRSADEAAAPPFWRRLRAAGDELASFLPADSPVTAVVGPLPVAAAVVRRLRSSAGSLATADVIVLTDRAGIVSDPSWELVRTANRLVDRVTRVVDREPGVGERPPLLVVIDAPDELPTWVAALRHRLRGAGVGLFRYAVTGQPRSVDLERYRQGTDVPYAIDLVSRVDPVPVVGLLTDRHPIVSVAGADLSSELLLALRRFLAPTACEVDDG